MLEIMKKLNGDHRTIIKEIKNISKNTKYSILRMLQKRFKKKSKANMQEKCKKIFEVSGFTNINRENVQNNKIIIFKNLKETFK